VRKEKAQSNVVELRSDYYQIGPTIVISIYTQRRVINRDKSSVTIDPQKMSVSLVFSDHSEYHKETQLPECVLHQKSRIEYLSTKVEIKLYKQTETRWQIQI